MNYTTKGTITSISEVETLSNGALQLTYRIDNGEQYNSMMEFQVYKKSEHSEHMDNFVKYNKVGDKVDVEFTIRTFNWKPEDENKVFTSLSHWKMTKVDADQPEPTPEPAADLPF